MKQKQLIPAGNDWQERFARDFQGSPSDRIGHEWMLISVGAENGGGGTDWNTMTASWGGLGVLWGRDVAFMFIRPSRRTFEFANNSGLFTLSFFDESRRDALNFIGANSGRDYDKAAETGLTPLVFGSGIAEGRAAGAIGFDEAREIIVCHKLYTHDFDPRRFLDAPLIEKSYNGKDYHRMYIGEILTVLRR
ncbi:MAG: flavin reductase family protein [Treponema sp.]|jgi:flavin reductase (DIM6/NTAB) family NADH-FMN oxidoreductase RutF|nr:flavin reductase family protein [Treponema sp.]